MPDEWSVLIRRQAEKDLEKLNQWTRNRVFALLETLAHEPRPQGCVKLQGHVGTYRLRTGDYRVIYSVDDPNKTITILNIKHRQSAYR